MIAAHYRPNVRNAESTGLLTTISSLAVIPVITTSKDGVRNESIRLLHLYAGDDDDSHFSVGEARLDAASEAAIVEVSRRLTRNATTVSRVTRPRWSPPATG